MRRYKATDPRGRVLLEGSQQEGGLKRPSELESVQSSLKMPKVE
ncbi:hypothetical protein VTN00DRAFT_3499 [Thermoascus crustaceus]